MKGFHVLDQKIKRLIGIMKRSKLSSSLLMAVLKPNVANSTAIARL
jgi:hypothetical protein